MYELRQRYEWALAEVTKEELREFVNKDSQLLRAYVTARMIPLGDDFKSRYRSLCREEKYAQVVYKNFYSAPPLDAEFFELCKLPFADFLRYVVPELTLNLPEFLCFWEEKAWEIWVMAHHLFVLNLLSYDLLNGKENAEIKSKEGTLIERIYVRYQKLDAGVDRLNFDDFQRLYRAVLSAPLDRKELDFSPAGKKNAVKLMQIFSEETDWYRQQYYQLSVSFYVDGKTPDEILAANPPSIFSQNKDWTERKKVLQSIQKQMLMLKPLDVLGAVFLYRRRRSHGGKSVAVGDDFLLANNDVPLENGLVFASFLSSLGPADEEEARIFVFFPTPFFVRKWSVDEETCGRNVTFIVASEAEKKLYEWHFGHAAYAGTEHNNFKFLCLDQWLSDEERTREKTPDRVLIFSSGMESVQKQMLLQAFKKPKLPVDVYDLIGTHEVETVDSSLLDSLFDDSISIKELVLIPQGINNCTRPRRKILAHYQVNGTQKSGDILLSALTLNTHFDTQSLSRLRVKPVVISAEKLTEVKASVRKMFRDELWERQATGRKNEGAVSYEFTPDITIWWSRTYPKNNLNRPRIEAYFCEEAPEGKKERGFRDRGKGIPTTMKHTTKQTKENVIGWLEFEYPFSYVITRISAKARVDSGGESLSRMTISVREEIIKSCLDRFAGADIAFKTLWYIHPDLRDGFSATDYNLLQEMVLLTAIGHIRVSSGTTQEVRAELLSSYPNDLRERLILRLRTLYTALEFARKRGYCQSNFLSETMLDEQKCDKLFAQVRRALVKRSLTTKEFQRVYDGVRRNIYEEDRLEYVGVMLRLLLGLESNIVCALTWSDLTQNEYYGFWQISVCRQATNNGERICGFEDLEDYRSLPCMEALLDCLLYVRERQLQRLPEFAHCSDSLHMVLLPDAGEPGKIVPPYKLDRLCRQALAEADIPDDIVHIPVGENGKGTKETNLNQYYGNFFRSNMDYWLREEAAFSPDEKQYFWGNKPATTFGRYYCDFLADGSQLILYGKLQRLDAILTQRESQTAKRTVFQDVGHKTVDCMATKAPVSATFLIAADGESASLQASVRTRFGAVTQAYYLDEDTGEKGE